MSCDPPRSDVCLTNPLALPTRVRRIYTMKRFYDAIITDPPYNIKAKVVTTTNTSTTNDDDDDNGRRQANRGTAAKSLLSLRPAGEVPSTAEAGPALPLAIAPQSDSMVENSHRMLRETDAYADSGITTDGGSEWKAGEGARAVAYANDLVGEVVWSLLSLARYSLKPGGRLCFFLPLRGAEARLKKLPAVLLERLGEGGEDDDARYGKRLSLVYATKQRMTSPNMCRWLLVLEKETVAGARM